MAVKWPEELVNEAEKNMEPYDVEGFVLGSGDEKADIMIVGEAPGENEAVKGRPFIGRAGDELNKHLDYAGLSRNEVYITSVVRSRPYKWVDTNKKGSGGRRKANRKPNQKEIDAHAHLLDYQIAEMDPKIIIALGGVAYQRLTGKKDKMTDVIGQSFQVPVQKKRGTGYELTEKTYTIIPLYHPAAVFYNPRIKDTIWESLDHLKSEIEKNSRRKE